MKSIDRLVAEHDIIERGLDVLEAAVARIESGQSVPLDYARWAPEFFATFADGCHHAKEEDLFFPLLAQRGIPEHGGPIGVMLHEHTLGRECVRQMRDAASGDQLDASTFVSAAKSFIPLLRQHIFKENNILFRMAESVMSDADDVAMNDDFTRVEQQRELTGMHEQVSTEVAAWARELQ